MGDWWLLLCSGGPGGDSSKPGSGCGDSSEGWNL